MYKSAGRVPGVHGAWIRCRVERCTGSARAVKVGITGGVAEEMEKTGYSASSMVRLIDIEMHTWMTNGDAVSCRSV